jgi:hypothetical protein
MEYYIFTDLFAMGYNYSHIDGQYAIFKKDGKKFYFIEESGLFRHAEKSKGEFCPDFGSEQQASSR